jgi:hypothetical protein
MAHAGVERATLIEQVAIPIGHGPRRRERDDALGIASPGLSPRRS